MVMAIRLVLTAGDLWRESAEAWLRSVEAWRDPRPTVVLTPQRAQGFYLRGRLVEQGHALLGVRFWTPSDARGFLTGILRIAPRAATLGEQSLLARSCAEKLLRAPDADDEASLRSVAQDPAPFLRAYDLLVGAGWSPVSDGAVYGRRLAADFEAALQTANATTQATLHQLLREAEPKHPAPLARVLVLGFNATHWPLWDLLQAVCRQADDVQVALEQAGEFGASLDDLWIGSWESFAGTDYTFPETEPAPDGPFAALATAYESGEATGAADAEIHFVATAELATQASALVLQALDYLRRPECTRLGLVFAEPDALALRVMERLRALDVPVDDGTGAIQPGLFESRPWQTWLDLQEEPTVRRLIAWLRACEAEGRASGLQASVAASRAANLIDRALGLSMVDQLDFLSRQLEGEGTDSQTVAAFLRKLIILPEEGILAGYLATTRETLRRLGWDDLLALVPENAPPGLEGTAISRRGYLAWLRDIADSRERVRSGNHFYGKVHLLLYGQLAGQRWSHLILTGLNEGVWPRLAEGDAFGSRHELAELNASARLLNRAGALQGAQGEGHESAAPGHGHCLLPLERHDLALRDLCRTLRATSHGLCLAARTQDQGRNLLPSDFFSHAWQIRTGQVLDETLFRDLAAKTQNRCQEHAALFPPALSDPQKIERTKIAFDARRDPATPFGRYQFAFATAPESPIQLSCKEWENALAHPAEVWLARVVGVGPWPEGRLNWNLSLGTWTHRWLSGVVKAEPPADEFTARVRASAQRDGKAIQKRAREAGIDLYPWWQQMWNQVGAVSAALAQVLAPELAGKRALAEIDLPRPLDLALPGATRADFAARGRLDLLLIEPASGAVSPESLDLTGCTAWVIDFKTGVASDLTEKKLQRGQGVQIALYGLALRARGAAGVAMSVLTPGAKLKRQLTEAGLLGMGEPFRTLEAMHRHGVFGQSASEDREHGHAPDYPMTTRTVSREVLQAKWALERGGEGA